MLDYFLKNPGNRRRSLLKIILLILIPAFFLLCFFAILRAKSSQKTSVCENAVTYAGIMDKLVIEQKQTDDEELPFASSLSTLAVLKDGQVLSTKGYSPLSWRLVAAVSELAHTASSTASTPSEAVYTYSGPSLPDYYFYYVPSQADGLNYCYYEPVLAGAPLIRQSFLNIWGFMLILLLTAILSVALLLFFSSEKKAKKQTTTAGFHKNNTESGNQKHRRKSSAELVRTQYKDPQVKDDQNEDPQNSSLQIENQQNANLQDHSQQSQKCTAGKSDNTKKQSHENSDVFGSLPYFSGIIIDYHNMNGAPVSPEILELFDRIIRENLSVNKILFQFSPQRSSDCLQYYMNYNNYNLRVLCDSLKMNLYNAAPEYAINIFYSDAVSTCQEMENELLYLHQQLRYSLLVGYNFRLSIGLIRSFETSQEKMDIGVSSTIQNHLRTRAYEDLYGYLRRYRDTCTHFARPGNIRYSFSEMYRFAEEAFSAVKLFFQENSFSHPMIESTCSTVLCANPGFGHFCDYLISCIRSYQQENQHVLSSRNEQIMNSIYMYIEQDLADANLNSIARKMQMTDSHLSRVFKKNTGTNFSEYLSDRKLEEAAKLLVQDNKIKVADIADMLGYGNPTYFLSRFKAKYGVSPTAYRKMHMPE